MSAAGKREEGHSTSNVEVERSTGVLFRKLMEPKEELQREMKNNESVANSFPHKGGLMYTGKKTEEDLENLALLPYFSTRHNKNSKDALKKGFVKISQ